VRSELHTVSDSVSTTKLSATRKKSNVPGSTTNLGERQLHTPHLALVAESIFADELQLSIPNYLLTRSPRHKRSKLALSGHGDRIRTDERTRKDDGGRSTSSSSCGAPLWLSVRLRKFEVGVSNGSAICVAG
jgi:hypothetical protein